MFQTSRKLNFHIEGYSKQKPDLLVEKVMLDVKDTNVSVIAFRKKIHVNILRIYLCG